MATEKFRASGNSKSMDDRKHGDPDPEDVMLWKVSLTGDSSGNISIIYNGVYSYQRAQGETFENVLEKAVRRVLPPDGNWDVPDYSNPGPTALSIANDKEMYLIFVLDQGNYRFSQKQEPFQIQESKHSFYRMPRCGWLENDVFQSARILPDGKECFVAGFLANSDDDLRGGDGRKFTSSFNIYLDLFVTIPGKGISPPIPIVVDPDVGFPEGTKT